MRKAGKMMAIWRLKVKGGWIPGGAGEGIEGEDNFSDMLLERRKWWERRRGVEEEELETSCSTCSNTAVLRQLPLGTKKSEELIAYLYIRGTKPLLDEHSSLLDLLVSIHSLDGIGLLRTSLL